MQKCKFKRKLSLFMAAAVMSVSLVALQAPAFAESTFGSVSGVVPMSFTGTPAVSSTNSQIAARTATLPTAVDLPGCNTPAVMNQGKGNSCAAFAIAYAKTFQEVKEIGWSA